MIEPIGDHRGLLGLIKVLRLLSVGSLGTLVYILKEPTCRVVIIELKLKLP